MQITSGRHCSGSGGYGGLKTYYGMAFHWNLSIWRTGSWYDLKYILLCRAVDHRPIARTKGYILCG